MFKYIIDITSQYHSCNPLVFNINKIEYEQVTTQELVYFYCLRDIMLSRVTIKTEQIAEPLILINSFIKSDYLHQFYAYLGEEHSNEWCIPPTMTRINNKDKKNTRLPKKMGNKSIK
eukprot:146919_1